LAAFVPQSQSKMISGCTTVPLRFSENQIRQLSENSFPEFVAEFILAFSAELLSGNIKAVDAVLPFVHRNDTKRIAGIRHLVEAIDLPQMDAEAMLNSK
jgi:hypothetical protein